MTYKLSAIALASVAAAALIGVAAVGQTNRAASAVVQVKVPEKVDNFRLVDQWSKAHDLYYYKSAPAIVIVSHAASPFMKDAIPAVEALKAKYADKGVRFFMIDATPKNDEIALDQEGKALNVDMPILVDDSQLISESLGVSKTAEVFVIDPKTWKVAYHGPIDDRFAGKTAKPKAAVKTAFTADAIDALIAGQAVKASTVALDTPALAFPERDRQAQFVNISYTKDVAPILAKNCVECHSEGGIGPFAMDSYEKVKGFAPMIREAIRTDRMPPFNSDPHLAKFADDMNLSNADEKTLVHWIEAGAPRGSDPADPLKINAKPAPEWPLGKPDLILDVPAYKVPASGVVDYQYPTMKVPLDETRWVKAVSYSIGNRQAVHHITGPLANYAVGASTVKLPAGQGIELVPGQTIRLSMHYTPFGKEVTDQTRIGLYFYPKDAPPTEIRRTAVIANSNIELPPGEARHKEIAYMTLPQDATLYSVFPHGHYRLANAYVTMQKPGQKEEVLVSLPGYDFNWQRGYYFEKPIEIPAGTRIITRYEYDNSKDNKANPDPSITVHWGEQSFQEMQYTEVSLSWKGESASAPKPEFMAALNKSRALGILDSNLDGKVEKSELKGRMGQQILANWDKLDVNKDGYLDEKELAAVTPMLNQRVDAAQKVFEKGDTPPPQ